MSAALDGPHGLTLERLGGLLDRYPPAFAAQVEAYLPDEVSRAMWGWLGAQCARRVDEALRDPVLDYERPVRHQPSVRSQAATSQRPGALALSSSDPLKNIEPRLYVEALTGEAVPANGWLCCPLPDHEDRQPSFQVLASHWRCFGCGRGGSIIDLAAALYGIEPRGQGYHELRQRIERELRGAVR